MTSDEKYDPVTVCGELDMLERQWRGNIHVISILFIRHPRLFQHVGEHIVPLVLFLVL